MVLPHIASMESRCVWRVHQAQGMPFTGSACELQEAWTQRNILRRTFGTESCWQKALDPSNVPWHGAGEAAAGRPMAEARTEGVRALCALLAVLLEMPSLRQNALIAIAVNAEVVPRLWFSHLKVRGSLLIW